MCFLLENGVTITNDHGCFKDSKRIGRRVNSTRLLTRCSACAGTMHIAPLKTHTLQEVSEFIPTRQGNRRQRSLHVSAASTVSKSDKQAKRQPREENVGLDSKKAFYVDHTCIGRSYPMPFQTGIVNEADMAFSQSSALPTGAKLTASTCMQTATHAAGSPQNSSAGRMSSQP